MHSNRRNAPRRDRAPSIGLSALIVLGALATGLWPSGGAAHAQRGAPRFPDILIVSVDTLRTDRVSAYGYDRPTSPAIDHLLGQGARFADARTVEPLTSPALCSLVTSRFPHEHGSTRNGLRMRPGMASLPKLLAERGYRTAAFVGNWTLRDELSGLGEHFEDYNEVFSRKRWLGLFNSEATGRDLTGEALAWLEEHEEGEDARHPWLVWIHYVEPHAPYRLWEDQAERLGIDVDRGASKSDRYDTEVAFVDREVGRLLEGLGSLGDGRRPEETMVAFVSDHGESLGEHGYWGHGRHLYENSVHIPMGLSWPGQIPAEPVEEPAMILDLAPTILGLLGLPAPGEMRGYDWSDVFRGEQDPPEGRPIHFQAHKGAVHTDHSSSDARRAGLLEVGRVVGDRKEVLNLRNGQVRIFDLASDPEEMRPTAPAEEEGGPSEALQTWLEAVTTGLEAASDLPVPELDEESRYQLEALGYIE